MSLLPQLWDCRCKHHTDYFFLAWAQKTKSGSHITPTWKILYYLHSPVYLFIFSDRISSYGPDWPSAHSPHAFSPGVLGFFSFPLCIFPGTKYLLDVISLKKCKRIQDCRAFVATPHPLLLYVTEPGSMWKGLSEVT